MTGTLGGATRQEIRHQVPFFLSIYIYISSSLCRREEKKDYLFSTRERRRWRASRRPPPCGGGTASGRGRQAGLPRGGERRRRRAAAARRGAAPLGRSSTSTSSRGRGQGREPSARETWDFEGEEAEGIRSEEDWARGAGRRQPLDAAPAARRAAGRFRHSVWRVSAQLPDTARQHAQLVSCQLKQGAVACWCWRLHGCRLATEDGERVQQKKKSGEMVHWLVVWFTGSGSGVR